MKGSTALGERLQPETFRRVFTRYFETARPVLTAHGGTVYPQIGDGILAAFGIPRLHEDDALRAVRAAVQLREALPALNRELERESGVQVEIRIGINTGEIALEEDGREQPTLLGDVLNVGARLEEGAAPGQIVLGPATSWLVRNAVSVEPLGLLPLRGRTESVSAYSLTLLSSPDEEGQRIDVELIGRAQEMAWLRLAYERTRLERTCHLTTVLGPGGVGKSRLVAEFSVNVANDATVLQGRCLPYGDGITFWPIAVSVRQAAGINGDDPPEIARARLASLVGQQERGEQIIDQVAQMLSLDEPGVAEERNFWALQQLLEILASRRPIILVVEDLHWAEPTLLDLIEYVAEHSREVPILIVCLAREELLEDRPTWGGGKLNAASILLSPLTDAESDQLIGQLLGQTPLSTVARATIMRVAEGNPLFIEELVATARDDDRGIVAAAGSYAGADIGERPVPVTVQALLATRLERLEPLERTVLEHAAVIGVNFSAAAMLGLSEDMAKEQLSRILNILVRKELIRPYTSDLLPGEGFRFRHGLIKDTTYAAISKGTRALLHQRLADWLEQTLGNRAKEMDAIIGYNLSEACRFRMELGPLDEQSLQLARRAGESLSAAGRRASSRGDVPATISLLNRAVELLPNHHPLRLEMLVVLAEALGGAGKLAEAATTLDTAISAAAAAGDACKGMRAEIGRLEWQWYMDLEALLNVGPTMAERAIRVFEQHGDDSGLVGAWRVLAQIRSVMGKNMEARTAIEQAIDAARRTNDQRLEARALSNACWIALLGPTPLVQVIDQIEAMLSWAERTGSRRMEAHALRVLARAHAMCDDFVKARELLGAANTITTRLGEVLYGSPDANSPGFIERLAGDFVAAEDALRRGFETLATFGTKNQAAAVAGLLARVLLGQNRVAEAEHFARVGRRNAASKDVDAQVKWRRAEARILAGRAHFKSATRLAREEIALADATDWLDLQAESRMDLAHVLSLAGQSEEAYSSAAEALDRYQRKGNLVGVRMAHTFLDDPDSRRQAS